MSKRTIMFVISDFKVGGAQMMLANITEKFDPQRFHAIVVSLHNDNPLTERLSDRVEFCPLPRRGRYDLSPSLRIKSIIKDRDIDCVVCFGTFEYIFVLRALKMLGKRRDVLISIHSTGVPFKQHIQHWLYARFLSGAERFISVCDAQADYWAHAYRIPREKFTTVYNGVDTTYFKPLGNAARETTRNHLMIPGDALVLIQVASFQRYKRHEDSLSAFRLLLDGTLGRRCFLLLVGGGDTGREESLKKMAMELGVDQNVIFCGRQSDVRPYYAAADLFTLTSSSGESFSVAALEAMAMGLPTVLTDVSGAREMSVEGVTGFLAPARHPEQIARTWETAFKALPRLNGSSIRQHVVRYFDLEPCVKQYEELIS